MTPSAGAPWTGGSLVGSAVVTAGVIIPKRLLDLRATATVHLLGLALDVAATAEVSIAVDSEAEEADSVDEEVGATVVDVVVSDTVGLMAHLVVQAAGEGEGMEDEVVGMTTARATLTLSLCHQEAVTEIVIVIVTATATATAIETEAVAEVTLDTSGRTRVGMTSRARAADTDEQRHIYHGHGKTFPLTLPF